MIIRIFTIGLIGLLLVSCANSARKTAPWQAVSNSGDIKCKVGPDTSGMLFVSRLGKTRARTTLAPESIMTIDASTDTANTFVVSKSLKRYVPSLNDYSTLSGLEIIVGIKEDGNNLILTPLKKKEYQVSVIGEWPIPKVDMQELANYFGPQCAVSD